MNKLLRLAVSVALLTWIGWRTNWSDVSRAFSNLRVEWWLAALGLLLVCQVASARRWQLFARALRFERSVKQLSAFYLIGMYFNLLLPTSVGGDVVRVWYLDAGSGRRLAAFASVFLERLNGLLLLIFVACVGVVCSPVPLPLWISAAVWGIAVCAALGLSSLPLLSRWRLLPAKRQEQMRSFVQILKEPRALAEATLLSLFVQVSNIVVVWLISQALGLDVAFSYFWVLVPMVTLLTLLPISVNGMGVREGGTALFLAPLGVPESGSVTLSFLWFAVFLAVSVMGSFVYLFGAFPKPMDAPASSSEDGNHHGPVDRDSDQGREGQLGKAA